MATNTKSMRRATVSLKMPAKVTPAGVFAAKPGDNSGQDDHRRPDGGDVLLLRHRAPLWMRAFSSLCTDSKPGHVGLEQ